MGIETILIALVMAVVYTLLGIFKSPTEDIQPRKAIASIALGLIIGAIMYGAGIPITQANVIAQLGVYGVLLYVIENIIKGIDRRFIRKKEPVVEE